MDSNRIFKLNFIIHVDLNSKDVVLFSLEYETCADEAYAGESNQACFFVSVLRELSGSSIGCRFDSGATVEAAIP